MVHSLKFLRVQSGMTLEQLAAGSGLTRSYLSKIERGLANPSIASALTIAGALGVTVERLFGENPRHEAVDIVRAAQGTAGDPASYLSLVAGLNPGRGMRAFVVRPVLKNSGRNAVMSHHEGEEILYVLSGEIELKIGKRLEVLRKGDCIHFDSTIPHKLTAMTSERTEALVIIAAMNPSDSPIARDTA
jgi:transcriptional regulator with XRE-family HTH domain